MAKTKPQALSGRVLSFMGSKTCWWLILGWFIFSAAWMGLSTARGVPPDEGNHFRSIEIFAADGWDPFIRSDHPDLWRMQPGHRSPSYLYHYVMSFPYRALPNDWSTEAQTVALRLFNVSFVVAGLAVFKRFLSRVIKDAWVNNLALLMLTNTLMFSFIAGAVNYDNLVFLVAAGLLYYFAKLYERFELTDLLKFASILLLGSLVKFTIPPLGALLGSVLIIRHFKQWRSLWQTSRTKIKHPSRGLLILMLITIACLGLFAERYGLNYLTYGTHKPQCDQVLSYQQCLRSALFKRNLPFRDNKVDNPIPTPAYALDWTEAISRNTYGILGHKRTNPTPLIKYGALVVWVAMVAAVALRAYQGKALPNWLLVVAIVYTGIILTFNYVLFVKSGRNLARQGRYLFPVLGIYYGVGMFYINRLLDKKLALKAALATATAALFMISSLPTYLYSTSGNKWHTPWMKGINQHLHDGLHKFIAN